MKVLDEGRLESVLLTLVPTFLPGQPERGEPEGDEVAVWVGELPLVRRVRCFLLLGDGEGAMVGIACLNALRAHFFLQRLAWDGGALDAYSHCT